MQVNHISDKVTHAVIGGNKARDFSISSSAEFFNILSSTLYSDKIMAVVRETLCNAWDIHIQTGRTDRPIEITITDTEFKIRDFGTGISDDDIVDVYCTYGSSTKKNDGNQTGGFGLGCKAPFAMVDHFEVTSFHEGKKTVYAVSKSSAEVAGKPSIMPIVSVPTDDSGMLVSMKININDRRRLERVVETIVKFGQMNALLNGRQMVTIPFSEAKHGFMIMGKDHLGEVTGANNNHIFCRYGNVVYPIPETPEFKSEFDRITSNLRMLSHRTNKVIILQAKPNTISVTPSRESLSMTPHTVESLRDLMVEFLSMTEVQLKEECIRITQDLVADTWMAGKPATLLTSDNKLPMYTGAHISERPSLLAEIPEYLTEIKAISRTYMVYSYPSFPGFREKDVDMRLAAMIDSNFGNKGKIQSFRKEYKRSGNTTTDWFQRRIVAPLMRKIDAEEGMDPKKMFAYAKHIKKGRHQYSDPEWNYRHYAELSFVPLTELSPRKLENYLPFLRNFIVLAYNRPDILDRLHTFPAMKHWFGNCSDLLCYTVSRVAGRAAEARAFFEREGYTVIDLTKIYDWEPRTEIPQVVKTVVKPRKKGLPRLLDIMDGSTPSHEKMRQDDVHRIEKPEFICQIQPNYDGGSFIKYMKGDTNSAIAALYGKKGGVCANVNQLTRFAGMGIPMIEEWLPKTILEELLTNPRIKEGLALRWQYLPSHLSDKLNGYSNRNKLWLVNMIFKSTAMAEALGITNPMTQADRHIVKIANALLELERVSHFKADELKEIKSFKEGIKPDKKFALLVNKIVSSSNLGIFDMDLITSMFTETYTASGDISKISPALAAQRKVVIDLLTYAIEG